MTELDWLLLLLTSSATYRDPNPGRDRVDGLTHALQAATRAEVEGAPEEEVVTALLHDAARPLSDIRHGQIIAEIMRGRLPGEQIHALWSHGEFQYDLLHGKQVTEAYQDQGWYEAGKRLARWDAASFSPDYPTKPLSHFIPMLERVYGR